MNSSDAHQQRTLLQFNGPSNANSFRSQVQEPTTVGIQPDLRAGSPCRQAATEIMEDISMETGMDDEAYRRDMINVFPGHPALPQQTHNLHGDPLLMSPLQRGAPCATMIGNYDFHNGIQLYPQGSTDHMDEHMEERSLATEPDWITQMLEQVQRVGLWNDSFPEEPSRAPDLPALTTASTLAEMLPASDAASMDPIPFYRANMESLLPSGVFSEPQSAMPEMQMRNSQPPLESQIQGSIGSAPALQMKSEPQQRALPSMNPVQAFGLPSSEGGMGIIGQNQSTQSVDYISLLKNALNVPGLAGLNPQPLKMEGHRSVSLELSNDGMKEVLASTRQDRMNDGPFRPPTATPSRHTPGGMRPMDFATQKPLLQQSKLQLELGLAADAPLDLRKWGYGGTSTGNGSLKSKGKRSLSSEGLHAVGSSAEVNASQLVPARPDASGCTTADSLPSAGCPPSAMQNSAELRPMSFNSGSVERVQQASDRKSGLSADEVTRLESLERYREKKRRRLYTKTIRYHKRKVNADARKRFKGRFVKTETSGQADSKESAEQATDPGHAKFEPSIEASDLQTV